jgi:hypothetical protein
VTGSLPFDFCFGHAVGVGSTVVTRRAVAVATVFRNRLERAFIFAGATEPSVYGVSVEGLGNYLGGSIHSNTGAYLQGANMTVTGDIRYRNNYHQDGSNFALGGTASVGQIEPYPLDFVWADFDCGEWDWEVGALVVGTPGACIESGRWRVRGDMTINATGVSCSDALFVVDGDVNITGSGTQFHGVTIVTGGVITVNGAGASFTPREHGLIAYTVADSAVDCRSRDAVITFTAADCNVDGILYAPRGRLHFDGSDEHSYRVGMVAETVELIGSSSTHLGPSAEYCGDYYTDVRLVL